MFAAEARGTHVDAIRQQEKQTVSPFSCLKHRNNFLLLDYSETRDTDTSMHVHIDYPKKERELVKRK